MTRMGTDGATDGTDGHGWGHEWHGWARREPRMTRMGTERATDARMGTDARMEPRMHGESHGGTEGGLFVDAGESVALIGVAGVEAFFKPVHSLFGGSVCECVGNYIPLALFLKPVVADGICGIEGRF